MVDTDKRPSLRQENKELRNVNETLEQALKVKEEELSVAAFNLKNYEKENKRLTMQLSANNQTILMMSNRYKELLRVLSGIAMLPAENQSRAREIALDAITRMATDPMVQVGK